PEAGHIGRRHRGDVLPLVQNPARRGRQKLGQEVEACRLAGAVRPDQRMNAAATHLESDVANGEETREFLGQSVGFENELISQTKFPRQPSPRVRSRATNFSLFGQALLDVLETVPSPPPPGRNMPSTVWVRQGGKLPRGNTRAGSGCAISRIAWLYARDQSIPRMAEYQPARIEDELPDMVFYTVDTQ